MRTSTLFLSCCLLAGSFGASVTHAQTTSIRSTQLRITLSATQAQRLLGVNSRRVVAALWRNDTRTLARYVHPHRSVHFSPYVHTSEGKQTWPRRKIQRARFDKTRYYWGDQDGTGDPIRLTWNEFRRQYLTPRDYSRNSIVKFQEPKSRGNTPNNLRTAYPDAAIVEFHFPGTKKYDGMDWHSLWLVWRPIGGKWYLAAIVGDRWTI